MDKFDDYNDISRFVDDRMPIDISGYKESYKELHEKATENLWHKLHNTESFIFLYGMQLREDWFEFLFPNGNEDWYRVFE